MLHWSDDISLLTERYMLAHGDRARAYMLDDISRAIGRAEWNTVHLLECAKRRLDRLLILRGRKRFGRRRP